MYNNKFCNTLNEHYNYYCGRILKQKVDGVNYFLCACSFVVSLCTVGLIYSFNFTIKIKLAVVFFLPSVYYWSNPYYTWSAGTT